MKVKSLSRVRLFEIPWTAAYQAPWDFPDKSTARLLNYKSDKDWFTSKIRYSFSTSIYQEKILIAHLYVQITNVKPTKG